MRAFLSPKYVLFAVLSVIGTNAATLQRRQCSETLNNANLIANELQSKYWNGNSYNGGEAWTDNNALEDLHNLMLAAGSDTWEYISYGSVIGLAALNPSQDWNTFFGGSYDDAQWAILALWKICDYRTSRGQDCSAYMSSSLAIYDMVAQQWDSACGGGVWWSSAKTYKNAITNELFLLTSASAYLRTQVQGYLSNAIMEYQWLSASGMQGSNGLFNDGLDSSTCQNNGQTTWTYNQAVVASGLAALYAATNDAQYLQAAQVSLDATIQLLTSDGILKESCDDAQAGGSQCDNDQSPTPRSSHANTLTPATLILFFLLRNYSRQGIWMKHVQYFLDMANDASITAKYSSFLWAQYSAVWHYGMNAANDVGSVWYAPDQGGSEWAPQSSTSGLEAVVSAAKYAACQPV